MKYHWTNLDIDYCLSYAYVGQPCLPKCILPEAEGPSIDELHTLGNGSI